MIHYGSGSRTVQAGVTACQTVGVGIRQVRDLGIDACDVVFEDDDHLLAVDDNADMWRVGLDGVGTLTWSPDGTHLAVNAEHLAVVDPTGAQPHRALSAEAWGWTPAGQLLLYDWGHKTAPGVFSLADPTTGQRQVLGEPDDVGAWGSAEAIAVTADGDACMIAYVKGLVWYSLSSLEILHAQRSDDDRIDHITMTADRATVVVDHERGVRLWNLATAEPLTPMLRTLTSARPAPSGNRYICRTSTPSTGQRAPSWSIWELT